ncbi:MAG: cytochrome C [Betaproteobacteria bacterium]|nr:MAG: cytochrome C [Betaproteobacteria bacterium]
MKITLWIFLGAFLVSAPASAVPSFARQTGFECVQCHLSWPELTPLGRAFKLGGYTLIKESKDNKEERPWFPTQADGPPPKLPVAAMLQLSGTNTRSTAGADPDQFPRNNAATLQQFSLFYAGRITDLFGAFVQWSYDGIEHHSAIDNVDLRFAKNFARGDLDLAYGLSLNNNPTVSDIYNTTPAWGFPFASSSVAVAPNAATLIDGGLGQQVVGLGAYAMVNQTLYAEIAPYRTADGAFSIFRAGTDKTTDAVLKGTAPYWRLALQHAWNEGTHSMMIGTYGIDARKFPDSLDPTGPTDRFLDTGIDAQYQYITDRHRFSAQLNWVREKQTLDATFGAGAASNPSDTLKTFRGKLTYYYDRQYGATLAYFRTWGNSDDALYNTGEPVTGSANGSPNTSGYIVELDWLPRRDIRLALQYTGYRTFNGASTNYDGFGRNARDNDTLYLVGWLMF